MQHNYNDSKDEDDTKLIDLSDFGAAELTRFSISLLLFPADSWLHLVIVFLG